MSARGRCVSCVAAVSVLAVTACGRDGGTEAAAAPPSVQYRVPVEVYTIRTERFVDTVQATGLLEAEADITLTAEVGGTVRFTAKPIGSKLEAGAPVVELDAADLELALAQAQGAVERAEAAHEKAREDMRTDTNLVTQGLAPERQGIAMRLAERMSAAAIREARAQRDLAARRVEKAHISSPVAGVLSETHVEVGEWVAPGTPVARVVSLQALTAVVHLSEAAAARVRAGQPAWIEVDTVPGVRFPAIVDGVSPTAAPRTRTFATEIRVPNTGPVALRAGMAARVFIEVDAAPDARVIPLDCVAELDGAPHVFRLEEGAEGQVARAEPVHLGLRVGRRAQLLEGPPPGTVLAASAVDLLVDGGPVQVVEEAPGS